MLSCMKRSFFIVAILLVFLSATEDTQAQNSILRHADKQFNLENYFQASEAYKKAYNRKAKYETAVKLAGTLDKFGAYDEAYEWWTRVIGYPESTKEDYCKYLSAAIKVGDWDQIDELLENRGYVPADFPELNIEGIKKLSEKSPNLKLAAVEEINTDASEFGISIDANGSKLFSSDRGPVGSAKPIPAIRLDAKNDIFSQEKSNFNEREFYKLYKLDTSGAVSSVTTDLTDALHLTDPHFSTELDLVFYTAFVAKTKVKGRKNLENHAGIYFGKLDATGKITQSKPFPFNDHLAYGVMNPFVDNSTRRLYFASDMPGGQGGFDIYYSDFDENLKFSKPVNLGPKINTSHNESHPTVHGNKLYFASRGHIGFGGIDLFEADYKDGNVDKVKNMGLPYNSNRDDFFFVITQNGKKYLSSDRKGGLGMDDIYSIEEMFKFLKVIVEDCNGEPITSFEPLLVDNLGNVLKTELSTEGHLISELSPESNFSLRIEKKGYFKVSDESLTTVGFDGDTLIRKYVMAAIPYKSKLYTDNVYYDFDRSNIRDSERATLDRIGGLMMENPHTVLFVSSHTDSRGLNTYNQALSERRAQSVNAYLTALGIASDRIKLEWFGEEMLVNDCVDGVPCSETNHQLNRRSELVLTAFVDQEVQYEMPEGLTDPCDIVLQPDLPSYSGVREIIAEDLAKSSSANELPVVYFDFDRSDLRQVHQQELDDVIVQMKSNQSLNLIIEGHTDQRGNDVYNEYLSERRAKAVVDYLIERGISRDRLEYTYYGENLPIHDCESINCAEALHQENRRTTLRWNTSVP